MSRALVRTVIALLPVLPLALLPGPVSAACHIAGFVDPDVPVAEGKTATLKVELRNRAPTCSGTVRYETVNGSATAPADYTAKEGTLIFQTADDREEEIMIPTGNDRLDEPNETFTVRLTSVPGSGISAEDAPATVRIIDNDEAPPPNPAATATKTSAASPAASPTPSPTPTATASESPSPTPTPTETGVAAAPAGDTGGGSGGLVAGIVAAVIVLGGGGALLLRRRAAGG